MVKIKIEGEPRNEQQSSMEYGSGKGKAAARQCWDICDTRSRKNFIKCVTSKVSINLSSNRKCKP